MGSESPDSGASPMAQTVKDLPTMKETWVPYLGQEDPPEKEMATHSSILPPYYVFKNQVVSASLMAQTVKNPSPNTRGPGSIPRSGRSPREGKGNPLQYSCLENSIDRGAWRAKVHGAAKSQT